jgi:hypothetical protein
MCRGPYARPPWISGGIGARAGDSDDATRPHVAGQGRRHTNTEGPGRRLGPEFGRNRRLGRARSTKHQSTTNTDTSRSNMVTTSETTNGR